MRTFNFSDLLITTHYLGSKLLSDFAKDWHCNCPALRFRSRKIQIKLWRKNIYLKKCSKGWLFHKAKLDSVAASNFFHSLFCQIFIGKYFLTSIYFIWRKERNRVPQFPEPKILYSLHNKTFLRCNNFYIMLSTIVIVKGRILK